MWFILSNIPEASTIPGVVWKEDVILYDVRISEEPARDRNKSGDIIEPRWYTDPRFRNHSHIQLLQPVKKWDGSWISRYAVREWNVGQYCADIRTGEELDALLKIIGVVTIRPSGPLHSRYNYPQIFRD